MRTLNSAKNMASSLFLTLSMILLGFFTRKVFVDNIGVQYLGLNGLLSNILGVMSLLEGGFAASVVYNLYKPLAEDDRPKIIALMQLYRRVYRYIALGLAIFALCLYPFLGYFIKGGEDLEYVSVVYFIFVFNSIVGYFAAYKWSIINASQQVYRLTLINTVYQVGLNLTKLAILYYTKNYILYLVVESLFGVGLNVAYVHKANKLFPYINTKKKYEVEKETKNVIITNMKALFLHKLGGYFMHSTDNIVVSAFVGVSTVGLYSNYTLLTSVINTMVNQVLGSFSESVGNLIASENREKVYNVFKTIFFIDFLVSSIPVIIMFNTLGPFISWWLGDEYRLPNATLYAILLNFYIYAMRSSSYTFKTKSGIFVQDRFTPLLQGILNLVLSLLFVRWWGLTGVLFATSLSLFAIGFWQFPRLVYKYTFHQPLSNYFKKYVLYTIIGLITMGVSAALCHLNPVGHKLVYVIVNGIISVVCIAVIYFLAFCHTEQFGQMLMYAKTIFKRKK